MLKINFLISFINIDWLTFYCDDDFSQLFFINNKFNTEKPSKEPKRSLTEAPSGSL